MKMSNVFVTLRQEVLKAYFMLDTPSFLGTAGKRWHRLACKLLETSSDHQYMLPRDAFLLKTRPVLMGLYGVWNTARFTIVSYHLRIPQQYNLSRFTKYDVIGHLLPSCSLFLSSLLYISPT